MPQASQHVVVTQENEPSGRTGQGTIVPSGRLRTDRETLLRHLRGTETGLRALALASIVVPFLFCGLGAWFSYEHRLREAVQLVERTAEILDEQARRVLDVQSLVIRRVDDRLRGMSWDDIGTSAELHAWLQTLDEAVPQVDLITLVDRTGRIRNSSGYLSTSESADVTDRDFFKALQEQDRGLYLGETVQSRSRPGLLINVARRRSSQSGAFDGMIIASLDPKYFASAAKALIVAPGDSVSLIREDGVGLARGPEPLTEPVRLVPSRGLLAALSQGERGVFRHVAQIDGVERLYGFRRVAGVPAYAVFGRSMTAVRGDWLREVAIYAVLATVASAALLALSLLAMRRTRDQHLALARMRESEARYHALFNRSPVCMLLSDVDADGSVRFNETNEAWVELIGYSPEQVKGRTPEEVFPPATAATISENYRQCVTMRRPVEYEVEGDGPNGHYVRRAVVMPIMDGQGRVTKLLATSLDLTESRELEQRLVRSQKMEALAALVSGVAHDFNNLLTIVLGNLDLLRRAADERRPRLIQNALAAVEQGRRLTGRLLAFSRRQVLNPEVVDLKRLIEATQDMLGQSLRGDITIKLDLPDDLWTVKVDPSQLQVALINLAVNARDAMPKGGTFRIAAENRVQPGLDGTEMVALAVSDTGEGMARDVLQRAFEPFFTTKDVGRGTGLGLSQVYGFAQQSGGSVDIASELGRGSRVTLYLPRAGANAIAEKKVSASPLAAKHETRGCRIVLVEDSPEVAEVTRALLAERGHDVVLCTNAREALRALEQQSFDVLCSDLVMPGDLNGLDLARQAQARWPTMPVILMTGYSDAASAARAEGFTLLTKPNEPERLVETVQNALAQRPSNVVAMPRPR